MEWQNFVRLPDSKQKEAIELGLRGTKLIDVDKEEFPATWEWIPPCMDFLKKNVHKIKELKQITDFNSIENIFIWK